jgi:hypothetical protein
MGGNYVNQFGVWASGGTDGPTLPEAELWTQVILQAIHDLEGRTLTTPGSAQDSAREWFASESDAVGSLSGLVRSSMWTQISFARAWPRSSG